MHKKTNKDVFLVCQINAVNEWYDEKYKGPDKETMREYHIKAMEHVYDPKRFERPGHPSKEETKEFMDGVESIVRKTAGNQMSAHDLQAHMTTLIL
jgi:hypothetical protein